LYFSKASDENRFFICQLSKMFYIYQKNMTLLPTLLGVFGLGGPEMTIVLIVFLLPLYIAYKMGYNSGYIKGTKDRK